MKSYSKCFGISNVLHLIRHSFFLLPSILFNLSRRVQWDVIIVRSICTVPCEIRRFRMSFSTIAANCDRFLSRVLRRNVSLVPIEASWQTFRNGILPWGESSPPYISFVSSCRARLATKNTGLSFVCFARAFRTLKEQNEFLLPYAHVYTSVCAGVQTRIRALISREQLDSWKPTAYALWTLYKLLRVSDRVALFWLDFHFR